MRKVLVNIFSLFWRSQLVKISYWVFEFVFCKINNKLMDFFLYYDNNKLEN